MKTAAFVAALGLSAFAVAKPRQHHRHQDKHVKRDVVVTLTNTVYAEPTQAEKVVVIVNQFGIPVSTVTEAEPIPSVWSTASAIAPTTSSSSSTTSTTSTSSTSSSSSSTSISSTPVVVAAIVQSSSSSYSPPPPPPPPTTSSTPVAPTSEAAPASSPVSAPEGNGFGFVYSPYNADNSCKTQDQVNSDFDAIPGGFSLVRTYGTDCNQVATVKNAAKAKGVRMFVGVFDLGSIHDEISAIVAAASDDWNLIDTISIGNELVNSGSASAGEVIAAVGIAQVLLKAAGYKGNVITVDTLVATRSNPSLCTGQAYCAVNCHPFFDGNVAAADSGSFLTTQIATLQSVLADSTQRIIISETGWPWKGESNGAAVPSPENQAAALSSIKSAFASNPSGVILFTTFNDAWKTNNAYTFGAEQYWGFLGDSPSG